MNLETRIQRLEDHQNRRQCQTCFDTGTTITHVPPGEDRHAAEWNPTHCEECARPYKLVRQIVGIPREMTARMLARARKVA